MHIKARKTKLNKYYKMYTSEPDMKFFIYSKFKNTYWISTLVHENYKNKSRFPNSLVDTEVSSSSYMIFIQFVDL